MDDFVGRAWVFDALTRWLAAPAGGRWFLLQGGPGSGKTALANRLVQFSEGVVAADSWPLLGPRALACSHFCRAGNDITLNPLRFVEALSTALAQRYAPFAAALLNLQQREPRITITQTVGMVAAGGVVYGVNQVIITDLPTRHAFDLAVRRPLEQLCAPGFAETILLLVDSLDEALTYRGETIAELIHETTDDPAELPAQVRLILTSRPEVEIAHWFGAPTLDLNADQPPGVDDVLEYALHRLAPLSEPRKTRLATRLAEKRHVSRFNDVARSQRSSQRIFALADVQAYDAALSLAALHSAKPRSQALLRLWIAWQAARTDPMRAHDIARQAIELLPLELLVAADEHAPLPGGVWVAATGWLLARIARCVESNPAVQQAWLTDVLGNLPAHVRHTIADQLRQPPSAWAMLFQPVYPGSPDESITMMEERVKHQQVHGEESFHFRRGLAWVVAQTREDPDWHWKYVVRAVALVALDDYPSYREMALGWLAAAALTSDEDEQVDLALRTILETSIDQVELAFSGNLAAVTLVQRAALQSRTLTSAELLQELWSVVLPSVASRGLSWLDTGIGLVRSDPWALEIRLRVAVAIALHSQNRTSEAAQILYEALRLPYQETYAGYRAPACLSVACMFMALGDVAGAAMAIAEARNAAQAMLDDALGAERLALVDAMQAWLDTTNGHSQADIDNELRRIPALSDVARGLRLEYLAARHASDQGALRRLALAAISDLTVADTILAWLARLAVQRGDLRGARLESMVDGVRIAS